MNKYKNIKCYLDKKLYNEYKLTKIDDNAYSYIDDNCNNVIKIKEDYIIITRFNDEFNLTINSKEQIAKYSLLKYNYTIDINIQKIKVNNLKESLEIIYKLESNEKEITLQLQ